GQVDAGGGGEHFAQHVDAFVNTHRVVEHVAKVQLDFGRDQVAAAARQLAENVLQRRNRHAKLGQFALEIVQLAGCAVAVVAGKNVLFPRVQGLREFVDDGLVLVDDLVEDGVQRRPRAVSQQLRLALQEIGRAHV